MAGIAKLPGHRLTVVAIVAVLALVVERLAAGDSRALSRFQDYALPLVIGVPFASGFLVMHPGCNPFPYEATLLAHVLSANLLLILIPLTKLSHMVLLPAMQLVSELAWHFPPDAGSKVAAALRRKASRYENGSCDPYRYHSLHGLRTMCRGV